MKISRWNLRKMKRFPDGEPMGVARPSNPERVMELVKELEANPASRTVWSTQLWRALEKQLGEECAPYTFVGYLARANPKEGQESKVLDEKGKPINVMKKGDSIVRPSEWAAPAPGSLQQDVRETRARLADAQQVGDRAAVAVCVAELRTLADRADAEAAEGGFQTRASTMLRELADETEGSD